MSVSGSNQELSRHLSENTFSATSWLEQWYPAYHGTEAWAGTTPLLQTRNNPFPSLNQVYTYPGPFQSLLQIIRLWYQPGHDWCLFCPPQLPQYPLPYLNSTWLVDSTPRLFLKHCFTLIIIPEIPLRQELC